MDRLGKRVRTEEPVLEVEAPRKAQKVGITSTRKKSQEILSQSISLGPNGTIIEDATKEEGGFQHFRISPKTVALLQKKGITYLFPIQAKTFDVAFDGYDLVGRDRTGSGKTMAYVLPIIERFRAEGVFAGSDGYPKLLVLVPTRELAMQVMREITEIRHSNNEFRIITTYGGTDIREQMQTIRQGVEIVIATPGRIWDLIERNAINLATLKTMILDETDQMLDIGFQESIEKIIQFVASKIPQTKKLQYLLFSATIPKWVREIADHFLSAEAVTIDLIKNTDVKTSVGVEHLALCIPNSQQKVETIADIVTVYGGRHSRTIIFTETKQEANDVMLKGNLKTEAQVLHGDIVQKQREITFQGFREGQFKCLIATNVAARGLDIPQVDLIVQLGAPKDIDTYIHRSGRTARAGKTGVCITIYTKRYQMLLDRIEKYAKIKFKKIGVPQPEEIIAASARDIGTSFDDVSTDVLKPFKETAQEIVEKFGVEEGLCRALAIISGHTKKISQRSLLWTVEGYVTVIVRVKTEVTAPTHIWNILRRNINPTIVDAIKGVKILKDRMGAAFDIPNTLKEELLAAVEDNQRAPFTIEFPSELPELMEDERAPMPMSGGYGNRYGRGSQQNGGYGGGYQRSQSAGGRGGYQGPNSGSQGNGYQNGSQAGGMAPRPRFGDKSSANKLFVGNLSFNTDDSALKDAFEAQGFSVTDSFIVKDQSRQSRGFGYVSLRSSDEYNSALSRGTISIDGRPARINAATGTKPN